MLDSLMIGVIALVKSALTNEKIPLPEDFSSSIAAHTGHTRII